MLLIGATLGVGSRVMWNGRPANWPDLIASDAVVSNSARWTLAMSLLLLAGALASLLRASWGFITAATAMTLFVAAGFWANYSLFGSIRPLHSGSHVIAAIVVILLLRIGYSATTSQLAR